MAVDTRVPIPNIVHAHAAFRRTCFERGIEIDYTDWLPGYTLPRSLAVDKDSWLYGYGRLWLDKESEFLQNAYNAQSDVAFFAWITTPQTRLHGLFSWRGVHRMPQGAWKYCPGGFWTPKAYRPQIVSPAAASLDTNGDALATFYEDLLSVSPDLIHVGSK